MKNFRVFTTVNLKRIIPGFPLKYLGVVLLFLLFFPYGIAFMFGNLQEEREKNVQVSIKEQLTSGQYLLRNQTNLGIEDVPLELYVADKLARITDEEWETEALKAQAVLIRSGLFWQMGENAESEETEKESMVMSKEIVMEIKDELYGRREISDAVYQAVAETAGVCIFYGDKVIPGIYFAVSSGMTRSGEELGLKDCPYLKNVVCGKDYLAKDYSSTVTVNGKSFWEIWEKIPAEIKESEIKSKETTSSKITCQRDHAGYVLYVEYQGKRVSGEVFRQVYGLKSTCFRLQEEENDIHILVKGNGHGLGMSQYEARRLAVEGKSYREIVEYFFADVTIAKIE